MAAFDPNPPSFDVKYDIGRVPDIGAGYAAGIEQAGKGIAAGVTGAFDVINRRQTASDTLSAMRQSGMLGDEDYKAIYGKSLGAQEQMIGMHANQWIAQQAQARAMQQQGYGAGLDVWKQHQALLDEISKLRETRPQIFPTNPPPPAGSGQAQTPPPVPQAQPAQPIASQANLPIGRQNLTVSGMPGVLSAAGTPIPSTTPLASGNIYNPPAAQPQFQIGKPWTGALPSSYQLGRDAQGNPGIVVPNANAPGGFSFHPRGTS